MPFDEAAAEVEMEKRGEIYIEQKCHLCGAGEQNRVLLPCRKAGASLWVCTGCLPDVQEAIEVIRASGGPVNVKHIARRIYREQYSTGGPLVIRDVPDELRSRMDTYAFKNKVSLRELVLIAVHDYLEPR